MSSFHQNAHSSFFKMVWKGFPWSSSKNWTFDVNRDDSKMTQKIAKYIILYNLQEWIDQFTNTIQYNTILPLPSNIHGTSTNLESTDQRCIQQFSFVCWCNGSTQIVLCPVLIYITDTPLLVTQTTLIHYCLFWKCSSVIGSSLPPFTTFNFSSSVLIHVWTNRIINSAAWLYLRWNLWSTL